MAKTKAAAVVTAKSKAVNKAGKAEKKAVTITKAKVAQPATTLTDLDSMPMIPISKIVADVGDNVRYFKDNAERLTELSKSIEKLGVIEPLIVTPIADNDKFRLAAGFRRLAAAKMAGMKQVPCIVRDLDDQERLRISLTENIQRKNLSPVEFAMNCERVRGEFAWTGESHTKDVAKFMGVSTATVTQMEKLLVLTADQRRLVHDRVLGAQAGQDIADIVKEFGQEKAQKVLSRAVEIEVEEKEAKEAKKAAKKDGVKSKPSEAARARREEKKRESKQPAVSQRSIKKAAKEAGVAPKKARKIGELMEIFEVCLNAEGKKLKLLARTVVDWQRGTVDDDEIMRVLVLVTTEREKDKEKEEKADSAAA